MVAQYAVKLTEAGRRVLGAAKPLSKRVDERVLDALSAKQREQFMDALISIIDVLQEPRRSVWGAKRDA